MRSTARQLLDFVTRCVLVGLISVLAYAAPGLLIALLPTSAHAQLVSTPGDSLVRDYVRDTLAQSQANAVERHEIEVGKIDPRLKLKPCDHLEPFVPKGSKLWGKTFVGVRCAATPAWTVFVPVTIKVYAEVAVSSRALHAGEVLALGDFSLAEREITQTPAGVITDPNAVVGRVLARGYAPGQIIAPQALKAQPVVASGDTVKVMVLGQGFTVAAAGVALSQAEDGQRVRVRLETGRQVDGIAHAGRIVELQ